MKRGAIFKISKIEKKVADDEVEGESAMKK
jgi:hypothetical protein